VGVARLTDFVVDGRRLATSFVPGADGRPTIVFLHEGLGSISLWRAFPERVRARTGCGTFVYSRYGYGTSDPLASPRDPSYMHHEAFVVLPELLRAAMIERPVLFGHSDGASIALLAASRHPDLARALVLEAPHAFVEDVSIASIAAAKTAYETTDLRAKLARHHADVDGAFWGWNDIWLDPAFRDWNIEADVARVRVPVLVIQGEDDEYGTLAQVRAIEARALNVTTLVLQRCAHSPHRDQPEAVLDAVAAFLR
jgi:pimeloyl-ACP methyl ester carboxylesterase